MRLVPEASDAGPLAHAAAGHSSRLRTNLAAARRWLRSPPVVTAEIVAIAALGALMTIVPQADGGDGKAARLAAAHPAVAAWIRALQLDRITSSAWFLAALTLAGASLAVVLVDQWRTLFRLWGAPLTEASFRTAPYRRELARPALRASPPGARSVTLSSRGRIGLAGSPVFHLGLMIVVIAGLVRALLGQDAVVRLIEGETLPPDPAAYGAQWGGPVAAPFALDAPLRFDQLIPARYASGEIERLAARVGGVDAAGRAVELAVNTPLDLGDERLYLSALHGPAALVEASAGARRERVAAMLQETAEWGTYEATVFISSGLQLRLRGKIGPDSKVPSHLEARVLRRGGLLFLGAIGEGDTIALPGGETVSLRSIRYWAEFRGSRDPSATLAYVGFALVMLGALVMFAVIKVDTAVVVEATETGERVLLALRAQRFAPLFAERFERLVEEQAGRTAV